MARTLPIRLRTIAAATVVIATGLMVFNAYQPVLSPSDDAAGGVPIIYAQTEPFRVLPDDPGGAEIPNRGSRLFDVLSNQSSDDLALDGIKIEKPGDDDNVEHDEPSDQQAKGFTLPDIPEPKTESLFESISTLKDKQAISENPDLQEMAQDDRAALKAKLKDAIDKGEKELAQRQVSDDLSIKPDTKASAEDEQPSTTPQDNTADEPSDDEKIQSEVAVPLPVAKPPVPVRPKTAMTKEPMAEPVIQDKPQSQEKPVEQPQQQPQTQQQQQADKPKEFSIDRLLDAQDKASVASGNSPAPVAPSPLASAAPSRPVASGYYIQLASLKDEPAARAAYQTIRDRFPALVAGAGVSYPRADLGARGVYYRVHVGPFTEAEARKRCADYTAKARGGTCLVVGR